MFIRLAVSLLAAVASLPALTADPAPDTPLVRRGDVQVTVEDLNASLARLSASDQFTYRGSPERLTSAVSGIYVGRILAQEARAAGIDKETEIRKRLQLQEESLLSQVYLERFEKSLKVPDFEARAREVYAASPERYRVPEQIHLRHVVVDMQGRTKEEARRRAGEAREKILAGEPWYKILREYSNDPTLRTSNGELGPAPLASLQMEIAASANALQPGQTSAVFESPYAFHVVQLIGRTPAKTIPFEQAKKELLKFEEERFRKAAVDKKLGEITASKDVVIYTDNIAAMKTEIDRDMLRRMHEEQEAKEKAERETAKRPQ